MFQLGTFLLGTDLCTVPKIYLLLPLYINRSIIKMFLIKTLLNVIDSTSPGLLTLESIIFKMVSIGNFFVMDQAMYGDNRIVEGKPHFKFLDQTWVFWCCSLFCLSYATSPGFFTLESIIFRSVSIGNFFVIDRFYWKRIVATGGKSHFEFFGRTGFFLMS